MRKLIKVTQRGSILLVFLLTLPFLILLATYYMRLSLTSFQVSRFDQLHSEAQLAADAGADYGIEQISQDNNWSGTGGEVTLHSDSKLRTTYTVTVSGDTTKKTMAIIGKTYWPASTTTPNRTVRIYVDLHPVTTGLYSVVAGAGGLYMSNSSKIVGGDVFINGEVRLSNSAQIGLSTKAVNVSVADQICPNPADSSYPRVCANGEFGEPITINNTAHIYGTVKATNQTNSAKMSNPGLTSGTVAPQVLPTYDRAAQKAAVVNNLTGAAASCSGNSTTVTLQPNTKVTGNVTASNSCKIIVKGDVWITGNLSLSNTSQMVVDNSVGSTSPNVMIDGSSGASFTQSSSLVSNNVSTGFKLYTFYSTGGCSPDCSSLTGTALYNSRSITTINLQNSSAAPNTIFYAYWSQVTVGNSGQIGAVIGQTINLTNTGTITFGSSVSTGSTTWVIQGYRKQ
jgi:hypothetical protein